MGKILSLLHRDADNCCKQKQSDIFVDFEKAQATNDEVDIYNEAEAFLKESENILEEIKTYKAAGTEIREAMTNRTPETETKAWNAIVPLMFKLQKFYDFSKKIDLIVPKIFGKLCAPGVMTVIERLDVHQALVKQFAHMLKFVLLFDEHKMAQPALQNDISYFRRTSQAHRNTPGSRYSAPMPIVPNEGRNSNLQGILRTVDEALSVDSTNAISLFFADSTPMLKALSESLTRFVDDLAGNSFVSNMTTDLLSTMAKVCLKMLESPELREKIGEKKTEQFVLRVMVGLVILYDHVHKEGAFVKGSNVDMKGCVRMVKDQDHTTSENLLNALRYTTKHFNDESTPKAVKSLFTPH